MTEGSEEGHIRFSPELVDERIKASLEPLHAHISAHTETMDKLTHIDSTTEFTMASSCGQGLQYESPYSEGPWSSKLPTVALLTTAGSSPDMVTGATPTTYRRPPPSQHVDTDADDETVFPTRNRGAEYSQTISNVEEQYENIIDAITMLTNRLQATNTNHKLLHTQVPMFRGKNRFNEFEHLLRNQLRPFSNRPNGEAELPNFQNLLRAEAIELFQSLTISTETTLSDVLGNFRVEFTKDFLKEVA